MTDPAEKYRDKVDPRHQMAMEAIGLAAQVLTIHADHYIAFLRAERESHTSIMVLDPTLYRDMLQSQSFKAQVRMVEAASAFILAVQEIKADLEAASP